MGNGLERKKRKRSDITVLDLFAGCGGLSYGFVNAGFKVIAGVDNWNDALVTFKKNHDAQTLLLDLAEFNPESIEQSLSQKPDVVIGGPPCQGFSISGKRNPNDPRNKLYQGFVKTVGFFKPKAFVLENVPNLVSMARGAIKDQIISEFTELGYDVKYKVLLASDYGIPQNRRRVVFVGVLGKSNFKFPEPQFLHDKRTCFDAISDLPSESVNDGAINRKKPRSDYQRLMRSETDCVYNHQISNHNDKTVEIISMVPDGGNYKNLPKALQSTRKVNIAWTRLSSVKPSPTIDTGHRHHFHYKYNRIPTVRESARIQSFPDHFVFYGSKTSQYKQVGNAVPPLLAKVIADELKKVFYS